MTGKRYSAGAIFLQVVPVFADVQKQIERDVDDVNRALGDRMERGGKDAGQRAGRAAAKGMSEEMRKASMDMERDFRRSVEGMGSALDDIDMRKLSSEVKREVAKIKAELASIHDVDLTIDANFKDAHARLAALQKQLASIENDIPLVFHVNLAELNAEIKRLKSALASVDRTIDIEIDVDTKPAERKLGTFEKALKRTADRAARSLDGALSPTLRRIGRDLDDLGKKRIGVDISSAVATRELQKLQAELARAAKSDPDIQVRVDAAAAEAEVAAFLLALNKVDGKTATAHVRTNARQAGRDADQAANAFRAFNIVLFAAVSIGPALIPVLGAIAGGLVALGPASAVAVASLGAVAVGFSGIGGALQALGNQQDQAAMTAQTAARSEASAAKAVASARRSAARQIESALDRQRDAQKRYQESIQDVREAELALKEARAAARDDGDDIDRAIRGNELAIEQGLLDSFNATVEYNAVSSDGSATNAEQEQARINMEEAKLRLEELRAQQAELAAEKKKWDEEGVNGTEAVQTAEDRLNDALEAQRDAYEDLGDAAREVDQARADGARAVADAMDSQAQAMEGVTAQQNAVDVAFGKMGASGRAFALFLFGLRDEFRNFRNDIQDVLLPSIQTAIEGFMGSRSGGIARDALIALADSFGRFVEALSVSFQGQAWQDFFEMLGTVGPQIQDAWGGAFISLLEAFATILVVTAPFALRFALGLERMMGAFADWADSKKGQDQILGFIAYVERVAPDVLDFIGAFVGGMIALAKALSPLGEIVLTGLTAFFNAMAAMDPGLLSAIATSIVLILLASQSAYLAMQAVTAGLLLMQAPLAMWVFAIVGIIGALAFLYKTNEDFRKFVGRAWDAIAAAVSDAWEEHLKPALADLGDALRQLWDDILQPFFEWLAPLLVKFIEWYLPTMMKVWSAVFRTIAWVIREILIPAIKFWWEITGPIFRAAGRLIKWLWERAFKPALKAIEREWPKIAEVIETAWKDYIKPAFSNLAEGVRNVKDAFSRAIGAIKRIWGGLREAVSSPIRFVVNTLLRDGLIKGINKVLKFVKLGQIDFPGMGSGRTEDTAGGAAGAAGGAAFAKGGVLPGYTPGVDVHHFTSPTAGRLHLSGGEAIMRPEWTAAVGPGFVDQMNAIARRGGTKAVQAAMGLRAYAKGGIFWPLPGGTASTYRGHDGVDLNAPDDLGKPYFSATSGKVTTTGYSRGYGNAVFVASPYGELVYGHSLDGSIAVSPGQAVRAGQFLAKVGNTGNSSGPHLHFGFPGGTYEGAMNLLRGAAQIPAGELGKAGKAKPSFPKWILDVARDPLGYAKGLVSGPIKSLKEKFDPSPMLNALVAIPGQLIGGVKDRIWDVLPGPVKAAVKGADTVVDKGKDVVDAVTLDLGGFRNGGVLPYNGTMKYDAGGYLPPGLTSVVNLTGKPEPVFTAKQFAEMDTRGGGDTLHYEPHFEGTNLTSEDVAADLNYTVRRLRRRGKYAGVGNQ